MTLFPVGAKVKINPDSKFKNQGMHSDVVYKLGRVIRNSRGSEQGFYYEVVWDDGDQNNYR